jgi:hypothetical protein
MSGPLIDGEDACGGQGAASRRSRGALGRVQVGVVRRLRTGVVPGAAAPASVCMAWHGDGAGCDPVTGADTRDELTARVESDGEAGIG